MIVVEVNTNNILGNYYLTSELTNVFTEIETIHHNIALIENQLELYYDKAELLADTNY